MICLECELPDCDEANVDCLLNKKSKRIYNREWKRNARKNPEFVKKERAYKKTHYDKKRRLKCQKRG